MQNVFNFSTFNIVFNEIAMVNFHCDEQSEKIKNGLDSLLEFDDREPVRGVPRNSGHSFLGSSPYADHFNATVSSAYVECNRGNVSTPLSVDVCNLSNSTFIEKIWVGYEQASPPQCNDLSFPEVGVGFHL